MRHYYILNPELLKLYLENSQCMFWAKVESEFDSIIIWIIINIIIILPINLFILLINLCSLVIIWIPIFIIATLYIGLKGCDTCLSPKPQPPVKTVAINVPLPEIVVQITPKQ